MQAKKSILGLFLILCSANIAYADGAYQAVVKEGNVLLSLNDETQKSYKQGDSIILAADDLICLRSGEGVITISDRSGKRFNEQISKLSQCQPTPQEEDKEGWFSKAKKSVGEAGSEGMPANLATSAVTTSLIELGGEDYFVLENSSWHKNRRTLPLSLQLVGSKDDVVGEYNSHHKKMTVFFVPKKEIEEESGQSYALKVINKSGSELFKSTRYSLNLSDVNGAGQIASGENKALLFQLQHQLRQLKSKLEKLGDEHPEVADVYAEIARINTQQGHSSAAILNLNKALKIRQMAFDEKSYIVAQTYNDLGEAYEKMGVTSLAETNKNNAIKIWESSLSSVSRGNDQAVQEEHEKVFYEKENHTIIDVLYGTDRAISTEYKTGDNRENYFTGNRSGLQYGLAQVSIPKTHKFGEMERPSDFSWFSEETIGEHVLITDLKALDPKRFLELVDKKLGNVDENDILVFIHGYNVSFAGAVRRTAQLVYDLQFKGVPLTYSWPSKSETEEYLTDEASVQYTVPHLVTFLKGVIDNNKKSENKANIHIIGHSMGTRALSYAVKELSLVYAGKTLFKNIIFAAPDIDKDVFEVSVFPYVRNTSEKVTLYANSEDVALQLSASMHGGKRVGQGGDDVFIFDGLDTIDASGSDVDFFSLSHSYFSEKELIVNDLKGVIYKSLPPSKRKSLVEKSKESMAYWMFNFK